MQISPDLKLAVQTYTKTRVESLPSLAKYSKNAPEGKGVETGKIVTERTFAEVDDPDENEVAPEDIKKAYNYGK